MYSTEPSYQVRTLHLQTGSTARQKYRCANLMTMFAVIIQWGRKQEATQKKTIIRFSNFLNGQATSRVMLRVGSSVRAAQFSCFLEILYPQISEQTERVSFEASEWNGWGLSPVQLKSVINGVRAIELVCWEFCEKFHDAVTWISANHAQPYSLRFICWTDAPCNKMHWSQHLWSY